MPPTPRTSPKRPAHPSTTPTGRYRRSAALPCRPQAPDRPTRRTSPPAAPLAAPRRVAGIPASCCAVKRDPSRNRSSISVNVFGMPVRKSSDTLSRSPTSTGSAATSSEYVDSRLVSTPANPIAVVRRNENFASSPVCGAGILQIRSQDSSSRTAIRSTWSGAKPCCSRSFLADFDRSMSHVAGRMVLEQIVGRSTTRPAGVSNARSGLKSGLWVRAKPWPHSTTSVRLVKPARRQLRRHQPVIGRLAGVQRLAHRAEHRLQAGRLGARDAQRHRETGRHPAPADGHRPPPRRSCRPSRWRESPSTS